MKALLAFLALALPGAALAEDPARTEPQKPRPALNLRLDDGTTAAPRVTFGPAPSTQTKEEREKGLPELGGKPSNSFDRTLGSGINSSTSSGVIPSAMDPSVNRQ